MKEVRGYPLVMSPEAIELVYLDQLDGLARVIAAAEGRAEVAVLEASGWFWNDFPDPSWADSVRKLPSEDAATFERTMRARIREAIEGDASTETGELDPAPAERLLAIDLPEERETPPSLPVLEVLD